MVRVLARVLVLITLVAGCSAQARKPALVVGGALVIGGIVLTTKASNRQCESGVPGVSDFDCAGETIGGTVLGMIVAGIGAGVLVGAMLGGGLDDDAPKQPVPAPLSVPEPPPSDAPPDPSNPPPAMEPEPAQW